MLLRYLSALPLALALTLGMVWLMQALIEHKSIADELERPPLRLLYVAQDAEEVDGEEEPAEEEAAEPEPTPEPVPEPEPEPAPEPPPTPEPIPEPVQEPLPEPPPEPQKAIELPPPPPVPPEPEPPKPEPRPEPPPKPKPTTKPKPVKPQEQKAAPAKAAKGLNGPPIFRPKPRYPEAARRAGTQGWVMVGFTVTRSGSTSGIRVLSSSPPGVFDQAAREAVAKWRYQAQPLDRPGQRARIQFRLR